MRSEFLQSELWFKIHSLSKSAKRKHIAVAYLGRGAAKLIPLRRNDTLVVDMSLQAIKSGQTNPSEVGKYIQAGASVFSCANLHAKVYIFDKTAIVSSGNLSLHSQNILVEAGIVTQESSVLISARGFIKSLQVEPITPEYLKLCKRLYKPRKFGGQRKPQSLTKPVVPTYSRLWISGIHDATWSEKEDQLSEIEGQKAAKEIKNKKRFEIESIRWGGDSHFTRTVQKGDLIVQIYKHKVYPPFRIVRIGKKYKVKDLKRERYFIHIEEEKNPKCIRLSYFKQALSKVGINRITPNSTREIKSPTASQSILGLWS